MVSVTALLKSGALDGLSIGFKPVTARRDPRTGVRRLVTVDLWEVSLVTFPLMPGARVFRMPVLPALDAKYSPDQPRVPKGEPGGGQWTADGTGTPRGKRDEDDEPRSTRGEGADAKPSPAKERSADRGGGPPGVGDKESTRRNGRDDKDPATGAREEDTSSRGNPHRPRGGGRGRGRDPQEPDPRFLLDPPTAADRSRGSLDRDSPVDIEESHRFKDQHALEEHTHGDVDRLRERFGRDRESVLLGGTTSTFSTFRDVESAKYWINRTLSERSQQIESFLSGTRTKDIIRADFNDVTGIGMDYYNGQFVPYLTYGVTIVVRRASSWSDDYRIVTAFPSGNIPRAPRR